MGGQVLKAMDKIEIVVKGGRPVMDSVFRERKMKPIVYSGQIMALV